MSDPSPDRLDIGPPARRPRPQVRRRLGRAVVAAVATWCVLLVLALATSRGWRPPPTLAPLGVAGVPAVAVPDRHLPYAFLDRVDTVVAGGLRARVVRPRGAEGTLPGIVLVAAPGSTSRDDLADEAEALARGGLVVLTYDERREVYSPFVGDGGRLADDALAAVDVVARQPAVDPGRVGLLGFDEAGWVVPLAAERAPAKVAFVVLLSAPVVSPLERVSWTVDRRLAPTPNAVRSAAATALALGRRAVPALGTDVRPALATARLPTYAVWGAADRTLPVRVAVDRLRGAAGDRTRVEVVADAGHHVPLASGWAERVSDWVRRGYPDDPVVRGVQPVTLVGLATPPRLNALDDLRLLLAVAVLAALVAAAWPLLRSGRSGRASGIRTSRSG